MLCRELGSWSGKDHLKPPPVSSAISWAIGTEQTDALVDVTRYCTPCRLQQCQSRRQRNCQNTDGTNACWVDDNQQMWELGKVQQLRAPGAKWGRAGVGSSPVTEVDAWRLWAGHAAPKLPQSDNARALTQFCKQGSRSGYHCNAPPALSTRFAVKQHTKSSTQGLTRSNP